MHYDGVLRPNWPEGITAIAVTDDLALVAVKNTTSNLVRNVESALAYCWMRDHKKSQKRGDIISPKITNYLSGHMHRRTEKWKRQIKLKTPCVDLYQRTEGRKQKKSTAG